MSNKALLTVIIVILVGIFSVLAMNAMEKSPSEKFVDNVSEIAE